MFSKSEKHNINYLSKIVKIDNLRKVENADKLQVTTIDGANAIVGLDVKIGDVVVVCATESAINAEFLKANNLYENKDLNSNPEIKGYMNKYGRVKAIKLRGTVSRLFLFKAESLKNWKGINVNLEDYINTEFDTINGELFSWKYVTKTKEPKGQNNPKKKKKVFKHIIDGQFNFHVDTPQLAKNMFKINPDDVIQISAKLHGTSFIVGKVLCNKKENWFKTLINKIKKTPSKHYDYVVSSRTVIRDDNKDSGFYGSDVWSYEAEKYKSFLKDGMTIYGEIVGYIPNSQKMIQKKYDYGCKEGECKSFIYRITYTNSSGDVFEFSTQQVKEWCTQHGFFSVPEFFYGKADTYNSTYEEDIDVWRNEFLNSLKNDEQFLMEQNDPYCKNKVPFEGVVIRKESLDLEVYKLKCDAFFIHETKELDSNEESIEG